MVLLLLVVLFLERASVCNAIEYTCEESGITDDLKCHQNLNIPFERSDSPSDVRLQLRKPFVHLLGSGRDEERVRKGMTTKL